MKLKTLLKIPFLLDNVWKYNVVSKWKELPPTNLMINITYKCNSNCVMCNIWKRKPKNELTLENWRQVMRDPVFNSIKTLTVSGGEAFLYEKYVETLILFIDSIPNLRRLVLNTNGFLPDKVVGDIKKVLPICRLRKISLNISVSLDGVGEMHNEIRGVKHGFKRATETIDKLKKLNAKHDFNLGIGSLLMKRNIEHFDEMKNWLKMSGVGYSFQLVGFHETFVNNMESKVALDFSKSMKKKLMEVLNTLSSGGGWKNFDTYYWADMKNMYGNDGFRTTPCSFLKDGMVIDSLGDVYYCLSTKPIGNFIKEKRLISEIYYDLKNVNFRRTLLKKVCQKCNSGCDVYSSVAFDLKRFLWFKLTGKLWSVN